MNMARSLLSITRPCCWPWAPARAMADDVKLLRQGRDHLSRDDANDPAAVPQTTMQPHDITYYRERYTTELQDVQRTYQVPITEYQWKAETHRTWNPFAPPYTAYRLVPQTRWETKSKPSRFRSPSGKWCPKKLPSTCRSPRTASPKRKSSPGWRSVIPATHAGSIADGSTGHRAAPGQHGQFGWRRRRDQRRRSVEARHAIRRSRAPTGRADTTRRQSAGR